MTIDQKPEFVGNSLSEEMMAAEILEEMDPTLFCDSCKRLFRGAYCPECFYTEGESRGLADVPPVPVDPKKSLLADDWEEVKE